MGGGRIAGDGWLVLLGGGEFSFGETLAADRAWMEKVRAGGAIGFLPAASDSADYGRHFAEYAGGTFDRAVETIPVYRARDAKRGRNAERIAEVAAVYLGGGVADHLIDAIAGTPVEQALRGKLAEPGGVVVAIAAAAQAAGQALRSIFGGKTIAGLGWLPRGVVETNFDPAHDRRLRQLLAAPGVEWGVGIPAGSAVMFGPAGRVEFSGSSFWFDSPDADPAVHGMEPPPEPDGPGGPMGRSDG